MNKALRSAFPIPSSDLTGPGSPGMDSSSGAARTDGGPVVPVQQSGRHRGLSIRDWFAGLAMQGLLSVTPLSSEALRDVAELSYGMADAMLAEREGA